MGLNQSKEEKALKKQQKQREKDEKEERREAKSAREAQSKAPRKEREQKVHTRGEKIRKELEAEMAARKVEWAAEAKEVDQRGTRRERTPTKASSSKPTTSSTPYTKAGPSTPTRKSDRRRETPKDPPAPPPRGATTSTVPYGRPPPVPQHASSPTTIAGSQTPQSHPYSRKLPVPPVPPHKYPVTPSGGESGPRGRIVSNDMSVASYSGSTTYPSLQYGHVTYESPPEPGEKQEGRSSSDSNETTGRPGASQTRAPSNLRRVPQPRADPENDPFAGPPPVRQPGAGQPYQNLRVPPPPTYPQTRERTSRKGKERATTSTQQDNITATPAKSEHYPDIPLTSYRTQRTLSTTVQASPSRQPSISATYATPTVTTSQRPRPEATSTHTTPARSDHYSRNVHLTSHTTQRTLSTTVQPSRQSSLSATYATPTAPTPQRPRLEADVRSPGALQSGRRDRKENQRKPPSKSQSASDASKNIPEGFN